MNGRRVLFLAACALGSLPRAASAQGTADQAVTAAQREQAGVEPRVRWHDSTALWVNRISTWTTGVGGEDQQTANPYYDMVFYLRPRYYLWENERTSLSLRAQFQGSIELTNSDTTTKEHEFLIEDTSFAFAPEHAFVKQGEYLTDLTLSLPRFVIPTSKAGRDAGKILQLGVRALFVQTFPLREGNTFLARGYLGARLGYDYQFARANVPENSSLNQVRTDVNGHLVTSDQVSGAALAEHSGVAHAIGHLDIYRDVVALETEFGIDPALKFPLSGAPVCNVLTGCVMPDQVQNPQRYVPITYLDAYVDFLTIKHALKVSLGYENITGQIGQNGERRTFFWSPDAKFYLRLEFQPDFLLKPPPEPATARAFSAPRSL